jgi:hypothetical protein
MVNLTDTKTNHLPNIRANKKEGVGMMVATKITDKRIMDRTMAPNTMTTLTKLSTTMMKIKMMILRMMVKGIPISTKRTLILEIKVLKKITQLKGIDLEMKTMIESNRKEVEDMMEKI